VDWSSNELIEGYTSLTVYTSGIANTEGTYGTQNKSKEWVANGSIGDVDHDGSVTMADVIKILSYILGENPKDFDKTVADLNNDNVVTITDALILIDTYGLIP
jgi:hypothetical protein